MPKRLRTYLITVPLLAISLQLICLFYYGFTWNIRLLVFLALLLMNSNHQITIEKDSFSINFPLLFPIIVTFGPTWACLLAAIGLISSDEFEDPLLVFIFNRGSLGLAAGLSALSFVAIGGVNNLVTALLVATFVYTCVNSLLFLIAKRVQQSETNSLFTVWETFKTILPSMGLAGLFHYAYFKFDIFGVIAAYSIFITLRSGALFGHLEANYRVSLIKSLLRAVYAKDQDLMEHLEKVAYYSRLLAQKCGYPVWKLHLLDEASYFHDIGKLEIDDSILKKPGKLSDEEYLKMKNHPTLGIKFLKEIPLPKTHRLMVENIAYYHHERFDGAGYPNGLKGEKIPLEARIVAVADTWDAMTGTRCYRKPLPTAEAISELRRVKGTQLDPKLVDIFIEIVENDNQKPLLTTFHTSIGNTI